jgi:hypothetical protein
MEIRGGIDIDEGIFHRITGRIDVLKTSIVIGFCPGMNIISYIGAVCATDITNEYTACVMIKGSQDDP